MSRKPIYVTDEMTVEILESIISKAKEQLGKENRLQFGKFDFSVNYAYKQPDPEDKVFVTMTSDTYTKMRTLVDASKDEIGWHGTVIRDNNKFLITDILVYPQVVTGATVTPDQDKFNAWKDSLSDEQYNTLDFHGHSHVNMGVTPSGTDNTFQDDVMSQADKDTVKIFMITNKKGDTFIRVYDMRNNTVYQESIDCYNPSAVVDSSKRDIIFDVVDNNGKSIFGWYKNEYDKYVEKKSYTSSFSSANKSSNVTSLYNSVNNTTSNKSNNKTESDSKKDDKSKSTSSKYDGYKGKTVDPYYGSYDYYDQFYDYENGLLDYDGGYVGSDYDPIYTNQQAADSDKENKEIPFIIPVATLSLEVGCNYAVSRKIISKLGEMYELGQIKDVSETNLIDLAMDIYDSYLEGMPI